MTENMTVEAREYFDALLRRDAVARSMRESGLFGDDLTRILSWVPERPAPVQAWRQDAVRSGRERLGE